MITACTSVVYSGFFSVTTTIVAKSFIAIVNYLLIHTSWAREFLLPYAEKVWILLPTAVLEWVVQENSTVSVLQRLPAGMATVLASASSSESRDEEGSEMPNALILSTAHTTITIPLKALSAVAAGKQAALYVQSHSDVEFIALIALFAKYFRWDSEANLARLVGDIIAYLILSVVRVFSDHTYRDRRNLIGLLSKYLFDENLQLVYLQKCKKFGNELVCDTLSQIERGIKCGIAIHVSTALLFTGIHSSSADDLQH
ncbi:sterol-binding protein [Candidatus Vallotia cooleyia]|uniref:sterol-binding protein n=1 Tax=Candidatus Vallotiella adelgis TaxID=1177211 RepID=UPI001D02D11B|nr:sterol-binding protein [Candidatus Vallotia cooleyia]UDG82511.1 hypothetical protein GJV44_00798 [Candidatus Vallotia cooleyia]